MTVDPERARSRHRALADPSRARILVELGEGSPLGVREVAQRLGFWVRRMIRPSTPISATSAMPVAENRTPTRRSTPRASTVKAAARGCRIVGAGDVTIAISAAAP